MTTSNEQDASPTIGAALSLDSAPQSVFCDAEFRTRMIAVLETKGDESEVALLELISHIDSLLASRPAAHVLTSSRP